MNNALDNIKMIGAFLGAFGCYLFGAPDQLFWALVTLILIDIFTGIAKAVYQRKLNSTKMWRGMTKKVGTFVIVAVANILDGVLKSGGALRGLVIGFYIATEGVSIIENWRKLGLPLPKKLIAVLEQLRDDNDKVDK